MRYYSDDYISLYCGDCLEVMKTLPSDLYNVGGVVNKVITSPPYNIIRPNSSDRGYDLYKDGMSNKDYIKWTVDIFNAYDKLLAENGCILYNMSYGTENTEVMNLTVAEILKQTNFTLADILVWKKKSAYPNDMSSNKMTRICEFVYVFCRRNEFSTFTANKKISSYRETGQAVYENMTNFFIADNGESTEINRATFSPQMVCELIDRYVLRDDIVLDNFSGTGTTLVACVSKGIKAVGIELSEAQCEYTVKRLNKGVQLKL